MAQDVDGVLLRHGRLFDAVSGESHITAIAFDGRIQALGDNAVTWAEANSYREIDATGHTVMPGLIDAHCHISFDEPHLNDELFFHRREGLAAIAACHMFASCCALASPADDRYARRDFHARYGHRQELPAAGIERPGVA